MDLKYVTGPITKADAGGLTAVISTPKVDKDGESVDPKGLINRDEWLTNPLIYWAHEWAFDPRSEPIGKGTSLDIHSDRIESSAVWAPTAKAQNVRALVTGGFVRKTSIGFDPLAMADVKGVPTHTQWALREWSVVPMPANTDATIVGVKSALRWFADWVETTPVDMDPSDYKRDEDHVIVRLDSATIEAFIKATVADRLDLSTDTPNVVRLRDGKRVIASIRKRSPNPIVTAIRASKPVITTTINVDVQARTRS